MVETAWPKFQELIVRISFDPSTLHQSRSGSITGVVYFEFSPEWQFPSLGWNDFVVVLASWWMVALKSPRGHRRLNCASWMVRIGSPSYLQEGGYYCVARRIT